MKKILSIISVCAFTLNMFAVDYTARMSITLSSANSEDRTIKLRESADFSAATNDTGYDLPANGVTIYVLDENGGKWQQWATNNLEGTQIGFEANALDEDYTLTFSNVSGRDLYIFDASTGEATKIESGLTVPFSITSAQAGLEVNLRFSVLEDAPVYVAQVTTNDYGWASYSNAVQDVVAFAPAGLKIYKGAIAGDVLNLTEMDYVAANEGVVVYGTPNTTYHFVAETGSSSFANNDLKPASAWENHSGTVYVLHDEALYQYTGANFPANKAYLEIPVSSNGAPRRISFRFNGTTALENAEMNEAKAVKFVENGQVYIRRGNEVYNLQGQIVK
jgi:hypothetical protein